MTSEDSAARSRRGRPKGDKRQRTRAVLLEAARELVREQGYERTTMVEVARRAGMTSGAIYGNFRNRDELFVALAETHWSPIKPKIRPGATFADKMRAFAAAAIAAVPERRLVAAGRLSGMAYALAQDELRARAHEVAAASFAAGAAWLRNIPADELPMAPETLVVVIHAMTEGLIFQRLLTPELVPDDVFVTAFASLACTR